MNVTVHFFGVAHDLAGCREESVALHDGATVTDLLNALIVCHPSLCELSSVIRVAVNQEYASMQTTVCPEDEIAVIPPVSGG